MTKKPIVFLSISSQLGGAERSLFDLVEETNNDARFKPLVVLPHKGPLQEKFEALGIDTHVQPLPFMCESISRSNPLSFFMFAALGLPAYIAYVFRMRHWLEQAAPHSVHSTGIKNHILCCWLTRLTDLHFYLHLRDYIHPLLALFFKVFSRTKKIHWMAASQAITKNLDWHIPIFYDGLKTSQFYKHSSSRLKDLLLLPQGAKLVAHAGALTPWKGQMAFIEAAGELLKHRNDVHFAVIGSMIYTTNSDSDYADKLKEKVLELHISDHIHFLPFMENSREIYDGIDLLVHSSLTPEPFGRVILEALYCEKPVVAARAGGALEILRLDQAKDVLHTPGDVTSLVRAIEKGLAFKDSDLQILVQDAKSRFSAEICYKKQVEYLSEAH